MMFFSVHVNLPPLLSPCRVFHYRQTCPLLFSVGTFREHFPLGSAGVAHYQESLRQRGMFLQR